MAKSSKGNTKTPKIDETAEEAVEVVVEEIETREDEVRDDNEARDDEDTSLEMEVVEDDVEEEPVVVEAEPEAEAEEAPVEEAAPVAQPQPARGGPEAMLLGGVFAGLIGYGMATLFPMFSNNADELTDQLSAQSDKIAALEAALADQATADLSGIETGLADLNTQVTGQIDGLTASVTEQFAGIDERLLEVEKRPSGDGTLSDTALAAYQRELEGLRAELDAQKDDVMSAAAAAEADLAAARAEAEELEQQALAMAEAAASRAALNRIATAVETGAPYADALTGLDAATLPTALTDAAESGVATTAQLVADYPAAARAALATARSEGLSDDASGLGGFLRSQFDVRSTAPQEGDGPDAVLSRAEAAVKDGRVADALAELAALPEVARADMTDWTARAQARSDVLDAIATLSETYN